MTKFRKIAATAVITLLIVAIGVALYEGKQTRDALHERQKLRAEQASIAKEIGDLQASLAGLTNQLASLQAENSRLKKNLDETELVQLRSEVARLRPLQDEVATLQKTSKKSSTGVAQWRINELEDVGRATPIDALQTYVYSTQSDPPNIQNSFVGDDVDPPSEEALQKFIKDTIEHHRLLIDMDIAGYKILSQNSLTLDKVRLELAIISSGEVGISLPITLRKIDNEWKLVVFNVRDKQGAVRELKLINESPYR